MRQFPISASILIVVGTIVAVRMPLLSAANDGTENREPPLETPNVVLFLVDDMGWTDLACYGSDFYETPNIDRLASEGVRFTDVA